VGNPVVSMLMTTADTYSSQDPENTAICSFNFLKCFSTVKSSYLEFSRVMYPSNNYNFPVADLVEVGVQAAPLRSL